MSADAQVRNSVAVADPDSPQHVIKPNADGSINTQSNAPPDYEAVAASQTDQVLGGTGAIGDTLATLVCTVATAATSTVSIKDGGGSSVPILAANTPIGPYTVVINAKSAAGAWKVTTGAGVSLIATGDFSA